MNGRTVLGVCLVLLAVLAGATFLDRAQRLVPVYAAARDLPAGASLRSGDLMVVRVRLPAPALRHYLRPTPGRTVEGGFLAAPVRRETLVPAELVLASSRDAELVELPVQVDPGDMAKGLRPGDRVQVLAAFTEGARRGRAVVLLPTAEVVQVLQDPAGLTGTGQDRGVQLRMPSDRAPAVAAAIATARIFVVKAPGPAPGPDLSSQAPPGEAQDPPPEASVPEASVPEASVPEDPSTEDLQPLDPPPETSSLGSPPATSSSYETSSLDSSPEASSSDVSSSDPPLEPSASIPTAWRSGTPGPRNPTWLGSPDCATCGRSDRNGVVI